MSYTLYIRLTESSKPGLWSNIHKKRKRLGVKKLGSTGGGEGSSFKSKKEFDKLAASIADESYILEALDAEARTPPLAAQRNAQKVLDWKKLHRDEIKGMTPVGWNRARQLAAGKPLSMSTIASMAQFNRHRKNSELAKDKKGKPWTDAGYVAWNGWGGTEGIDWSIKTMERYRKSLKS